MNRDVLRETTEKLMAEQKGILAMDESTGTIAKRFRDVGIENTEENRRAYREMLMTTPGLGTFISGVILYDETLKQKTHDGVLFSDVIKKQGIIPGIKVDKGVKDLAGFPGETVTEGLDELRERLKGYAVLGARFAKWRATFSISSTTPTWNAIQSNAHAMARYAALCQEQNIVPIVEPEVLMEGKHTIQQSYEVTRQVHYVLFQELQKQNVALDGVILKTNMVLAGYSGQQARPEEVAEQTVACFMETVPAAIGGIVLLSGGQSDEDATTHLNMINKMFKDVPWRLTFSYGRGLQREPLKMWASEKNKLNAQNALLLRAEENAKASEGLL